jgi:hypothetical protein
VHIGLDPSGLNRHNFAVFSPDPVASKLPLWWKATEVTQLVCTPRFAVAVHTGFEPSGLNRHSFAVKSQEPVANKLQLGWKATELTVRVCPGKLLISLQNLPTKGLPPFSLLFIFERFTIYIIFNDIL